ncbi:hypothetical protein DPMN_022931 [Dreissena polymorpha]|uniref:Uncharacterized protein n=1 Tax=Dreissena polymorpha TaxID=45954 RepID=A0A9D4RA96_DREPO|nr:hypothetical protein DPMN_022931 [Dreissena polymorpha]
MLPQMASSVGGPVLQQITSSVGGAMLPQMTSSVDGAVLPQMTDSISGAGLPFGTVIIGGGHDIPSVDVPGSYVRSVAFMYKHNVQLSIMFVLTTKTLFPM